MGSEGLTHASEVAILNANYMAARLSEWYPVRDRPYYLLTLAQPNLSSMSVKLRRAFAPSILFVQEFTYRLCPCETARRRSNDADEAAPLTLSMTTRVVTLNDMCGQVCH